MMRRFTALVLILLVFVTVQAEAREYAPPTNYFYEAGSVFDVSDPVGDDKGPGYYTYPLDSRLRRGTFDVTRFYAYEEGKVLTFVIQFRNYVMTEWPNGKGSEDQGFVANLCDIYIDMNRQPGRGYNKALPGRQIEFADQMGWEKMILVTPLSQWRVYEQLKDKT
ncbi:MAG TPA: glucodextranase DOMON-like domain-containing protein, partial [Candidatus Ozemobacteraceae bacterium]|nr:glucodextranase DOMON-like domain-containing protein [Candidatus Ozemobacteraceae bacterium]